MLRVRRRWSRGGRGGWRGGGGWGGDRCTVENDGRVDGSSGRGRVPGYVVDDVSGTDGGRRHRRRRGGRRITGGQRQR
jgi:hypothetical protein